MCRKSKKLLEDKPIHTLSMSMNGLNMAGMAGAGGPVAPLAGLASLGLGPPREKDWDQVSMYSQKTDRDRRMYNFERQGQLIFDIINLKGLPFQTLSNILKIILQKLTIVHYPLVEILKNSLTNSAV